MLNLFRRTTAAQAPTQDTIDLLATLRQDRIPDPAVLRAELQRFDEQIAETEKQWDALDRRGDAAAFLQLQPLAHRLQELRARAATLPAQIADAERRRDA